MNLAQKYGGEKIPPKPYEGVVPADTKQKQVDVKKKPKK